MEKGHNAGGDVGTKLSGLQTGFKKELLVAVNLFIAVAQTFRQEFEENGPLIPGLSPMNAAERLKSINACFKIVSAIGRVLAKEKLYLACR